MALPLEHQPVVTPLPAPPSGDFFDETQWEILWALVDGALASVAPESSNPDKATQICLPDAQLQEAVESVRTPRVKQLLYKDDVDALLAYRPSQDPVFRDDILRMLAISPAKGQFGKALSSLNTRLGSLIMTGYWSPIHLQPTYVREAVLKSWTTARLPSLRNFAKAVSSLAQKSFATSNPYLDRLLGYADVPKNWKAGQGYDFDFIQLSAADEPYVLTTDVVIVGSGYGGSVSAKNLAEAGHRVLVVDKGYHFPPSHLPMTQRGGGYHLFDRHGVYTTENGGAVGIIAGGAWGGGGTINWSVCLKLQDHVRSEWAEAGMPFFTSKEFDKSLDRIWDFVGATTEGVRHNHRNEAMLRGCKKLGWTAAVAPQNTAGQDHWCGQCHLGCGSSRKRGPAVSWLPAAADAGAQFMEGFQAEKVLFDNDGVTAIGVEGLWTSRGPNGEVHTPASERIQRRVIIKARKVIIAAGSLWSPVLLMKSNIKNPQVGQNLHIHPCNFVSAVYEEETNPWDGPSISSYSTEFENLDEQGYGVKLEPTAMIPYLILSLRPWTGSLESKLNMLRYPHMAAFISLTRDRDGGHVFVDPATGEPRVDYNPSDYDRAHTLEGVIALAKICYVTGAKEIRPCLAGLEPFISDHDGTTSDGSSQNKLGTSSDPEFTDPAFAAWIQRVRQVSNAPPLAVWSSAHQMGSCRMSAKEQDGVVDERGRVWGTNNLVVADSSVFPGASGVNPMITVMTLADWISRGVIEDLRED